METKQMQRKPSIFFVIVNVSTVGDKTAEICTDLFSPTIKFPVHNNRNDLKGG
jgi:hypothetical protein